MLLTGSKKSNKSRYYSFIHRVVHCNEVQRNSLTLFTGQYLMTFIGEDNATRELSVVPRKLSLVSGIQTWETLTKIYCRDSALSDSTEMWLEIKISDIYIFISDIYML